jgi:hypothetical protein
MPLELGVIIVVGFCIYLMVSYSNSENQHIESAKKLSPTEKKIDEFEAKLEEQVNQLGLWVNKCKKCYNDRYYLAYSNIETIKFKCTSCKREYTLHHHNTHYRIDCIPEIAENLNDLEDYLEPYRKKAMEYMVWRNSSWTKTGKAEYDMLMNLRFDHFYEKITKKYVNLIWNIAAIRFSSSGQLIDKVNKEVRSKKLKKKLGVRREPLSENIIQEWAYDKINTGKKSDTIKEWAKNTDARCPDGQKCGGMLFKELDNSEIAFGHIIPQDYAKELPHLQSQIHHPDNLYLSCSSCNSSLGGNPPDKYLKKKIFANGTIGDWIREKVVESKA